MTSRTHDVKSWPQFFRPVVSGTRTHELRRDDRNYRVGDRIVLREYDVETQSYTGSFCVAAITSITSRDVPCAVSDQGLSPDFCILSVQVISVSPDLRDSVDS